MLKFHPICLEYSDMDPSIYEVMKADIRQHGQKMAIVLYDGMILDGRHRYKICNELGIEPRFTTYKGQDPRSLVISLNDLRRHYTEAQRVGLIQNVIKKYEQKRKEEGRAPRGALQPKVSELASRELKEIYGIKTSPRDVERIKSISSHPALIEQVKSGKLTPGLASKQMKKAEDISSRTARVTKFDSRIVLGDSRDELLTLKDGSIHCVVCDPPYGLENVEKRDSLNPKFRDGKETSFVLLDDVCEILEKKCAPDAHLYFFSSCANQFEFFKVLRCHFGVAKNALVWVKNQHSIAADFSRQYASKYELIWFCQNKNQNRYLNEKCSTDILAYDIERDKKHCGQKPIPLLEYLIKNSTLPGELVVDPFAGTGSTCVAAKRAGRQYWGCELEKEYYLISQERIQNEIHA